MICCVNSIFETQSNKLKGTQSCLQVKPKSLKKLQNGHLLLDTMTLFNAIKNLIPHKVFLVKNNIIK